MATKSKLTWINIQTKLKHLSDRDLIEIIPNWGALYKTKSGPSAQRNAKYHRIWISAEGSSADIELVNYASNKRRENMG